MHPAHPAPHSAPRAPASPVLALFAGALLALAGCTTTPDDTAATPAKTSARLTNEFTASAEIVTVLREERVVTLRSEDGRLLALQVDPSVRNFDRIAVGDHVRVRYRETLAASLRPEGDLARPTEGVVGAGRAPAGAKPGAAVGLAMTVRVKIESVDLDRDVVVFSHASGELVAHRLATREGREFARGLKVGDVVQLDYAEALALSVEEL